MPPLTDKQKEYQKKYYQEHKQKIQEQNKKYNEEHKEQRKEKRGQYYQEKREYILQKSKDYYFTEQGKKNQRIVKWKQSGVIHDDYDELYDKYINSTECELCNIPITEGQGLIGKKHLDHDHETGEFRNILCGHCNVNIMRFK